MDPTLLAILSIFGGAALTAGAGFVGAARQRRREHERWLREQRYLVHRDYLAAVDGDRFEFKLQRKSRGAHVPSTLKNPTAGQVLISRSALLGPPKLHDAVSALGSAFIEWMDNENDERFEAVRRDYIRVAREVLDIFDAK